MARPPRLEPGRAYPLGATSDGLGVNFALYSAHAERVELCLYDPSGRRETARYDLPECTDEVWHGYLPDARPGLAYGYRVHGPYDPEGGHRFNPAKLLLDPYARQIAGVLRWSDALFGYRVGSPRGDLSLDRRDSAPFMPKAVVVEPAFSWGDDRPPRVPWSDTVIYEAHVRGFSRLCSDVPEEERGTFAALAHPGPIERLRRLGVTAVELMPVQAFLQDRFLVQRGLSNYWGYSTLGYFAPEPRYLASGSLDEARRAVRRLHAAGIEVILDVVYNHTCEGNEFGPTLSWRGCDNLSYYRLVPDRPRHHFDVTGCGNTLDLTRARVLQMVMDSLRYWASEFRVDGFRFDLCSALGREEHGFDPESGFFRTLRQDPLLGGLKLIAEPWDLGPGGYQLGNHPPGFAEWNDRFRDGARRYWRGDEGQRGEIAARLSGSSDLFERRCREPSASVNFLAAHDGFTLEDLVSYAGRHNEANKEDNRDGHGENWSANWGAEGASEDAAVLELRERVKRAMLATLFVSNGTPMLLGGDECGRSQRGNNNAYCQDNAISWIDWEAARTPRAEALAAFVARLAELRRRHPVLRASRFLHGAPVEGCGLEDIAWFDEAARPLTLEAWQDVHARALVLRRVGQAPGGGCEAVAVLLNAGTEPLDFQLPPPGGWRRVLDSAEPEAAEAAVDGALRVAAHALVVAHARIGAAA